MPLAINELKVYHSGGATNNDPLLDLGGIISSDASKRVVSQNAVPDTSNITGVTIDEAYGNPEGVGTLSYLNTGNNLAWKPYGQSIFYGLDVSAGGIFTLGSSAGYLVVNVTFVSLPAGDETDTVTVANNQSNVFDPVLAGDSLLGKTSYRGLYIVNTSAFEATDLTIWIGSNTPGGDTIDIAADTSGLITGDGVTTGVMEALADELTAPSGGEIWSAPASYGAGIVLGNLAAGKVFGFWQRRTVPLETRGTVISNGAKIAIAATI